MIHQALDKFSAKIAIRSKYDNFIGGKWVAPVRGQYFSNITPITGKPVGEIARSTAEDIELALDAFNLLDRRVNDIEYFYTSRLRGESQAVADRHIHPVEPRALRATVRMAL